VGDVLNYILITYVLFFIQMIKKNIIPVDTLIIGDKGVATDGLLTRRI